MITPKVFILASVALTAMLVAPVARANDHRRHNGDRHEYRGQHGRYYGQSNYYYQQPGVIYDNPGYGYSDGGYYNGGGTSGVIGFGGHRHHHRH